MGEDEVNFKPELIRQELFSTESYAIRIMYFHVVYNLLLPRIRRHKRECNSLGILHNTLL
jgi:hypothetical protein